MFAYWHTLMRGLQPLRWTARMLTIFLIILTLGASWRLASALLVGSPMVTSWERVVDRSILEIGPVVHSLITAPGTNF